ncbi:MAG: GxxExxY protein [Symploca sp. SIO2E6]|nr:GxxExxY protein [Symploca sp. SIO2E6]
MSREEANRLSNRIIGAAIAVHRELGPGLLESAYEVCLKYELSRQGLQVESQVPQSVTYRGISLDCGYRLDLLVEDLVIVELKAVEGLLLTQLKALSLQSRDESKVALLSAVCYNIIMI